MAIRERDGFEIRQLVDTLAGNAAVILSDGETWSPVDGAVVVIHDGAIDDSGGSPPEGYSVIGIDVLIRHFLQTRP